MFFLPVNDDKPSRFAFFTYALIFVNVAIFAWLFFLADDPRYVISLTSSVPALFPSAQWFVRAITSMFMHGSWGHVLGNMFFLWVFGRRLENRLGGLRFLLFYLLAGIAGDFVNWAFHPDQLIGSIGASGAIAGV